MCGDRSCQCGSSRIRLYLHCACLCCSAGCLIFLLCSPFCLFLTTCTYGWYLFESLHFQLWSNCTLFCFDMGQDIIISHYIHTNEYPDFEFGWYVNRIAISKGLTLHYCGLYNIDCTWNTGHINSYYAYNIWPIVKRFIWNIYLVFFSLWACVFYFTTILHCRQSSCFASDYFYDIILSTLHKKTVVE